MARADDITVPHLFAKEVLAEEKPKAAADTTTTRKKKRPMVRSIVRMNRIQMAIQIGLFAAILGLAYAMLAWPSVNIGSPPENRPVLDARLSSLTAEVAGLRQAIGSQAEENSLFLKILALRSGIDRKLASTIARQVHQNARLYGLDSDLVLAIMAVESGFRPRAVSSQGATGLMQVMPQWKQILGIAGDLRDPSTSIKAGMQILSFYQQMYRDLELALTAYNRGPGPVDRALQRGKSPHTDYAPRVLKVYESLKKMQIVSG